MPTNKRNINNFLSSPLHNPANQNASCDLWSFWPVLCLLFQILSTFGYLNRISQKAHQPRSDSTKSKWSNSGCILSWLLNLVQTFRHARLCLQDLNESGGIPNCWEVWFWRSQLSLRLNAKIIGLLSYFISPMAGGITDIRQGPGPRSPRCGCHVACHEVLTNGRCSSWHALLYFVRMMNSLFHDRRVSIVPIRGVHVPFLLLPPSPPRSHH